MNGLYIGSSGMMTYMQRLQVNTNNIANSQAVGFKADELTTKIIDEKTTYRNDALMRTEVGTMDYGVTVAASHVNMTAGAMRITNSSTDFYLENQNVGETSFFVVQQNGQSFLTRNGNFSVNEEGYLRTATGASVLDVNNNPIQVPPGIEIGVRDNGQLYNAKTNEALAVLQVKNVDQEAAANLEKHENETFTLAGTDIGALPNGTAKVHNYVLENSNVDMTQELADLMMNQSAIKAAQRVMTAFDKIYEKEATELGK